MNTNTDHKHEDGTFSRQGNAEAPAEGQVYASWRSPSNIAFIKYWGKKAQQIPANPSFSMTLSKSYSETQVMGSRRATGDKQAVKFSFEGKRAIPFEDKIAAYLKTAGEHIPHTGDFDWEIHSSNNFPHSAGIASSASGFSALALCLLESGEGMVLNASSEKEFFRRASFLSRLGSGSACRSVYGGFALWGKTPLAEGSDDAYAIPAGHLVDDSFHTLQDAILIVSSKEKSVSSRAGHGLMESHPYARQRYLQAGKNLESLLQGMQAGDWDLFIRVVESEALSLHAMMMTSNPAYLLIEAATVQIIKRVRDFRQQSGIPVGFTLDAGPNIHLLYPGEYKERMHAFITGELLVYCEQNEWIDDHLGEGPVRLT